MEAEGAGIAAIGQYPATLILIFEKSGCPSNGCLVPNTLAQLQPDDTETRELLEQHFTRQEDGFRAAITNENKSQKKLSKKEIDALAKFVAISVRGFATRFRTATDAKPLRQFARTLTQILEAQINMSRWR